MVTDSIADMLTRIRNALTAGHDLTDMPASKLKISLAETLKQEGFIRDFEVLQEGVKRTVRIHLAYTDRREPKITGIPRVSKPGLRVYVEKREVPRVYGGLGVAIVSTSQGLLTGREARRRGLGGGVVCSVWWGPLMSRAGKVPITIPSGMEVKIEGARVTVKGPRGQLSRDLNPDMKLNLSDGELTVARPGDHPRHRAAHGLTRTLIQNMVTGVSEGFAKTLELQGVGYRAQMQGTNLVLAVGYSKPVEVPPPPGIEFEVEGTARVIVRGINKEDVGQTAADVRKVRPPEPYKGKGIRYLDEYVRRKAGKAGKAVH